MSAYQETQTEYSNADLLDGPDLQPTGLQRLPPPSSRPTSIDEFVTSLVGTRTRDPIAMVKEARRIGQMLGKKGFYRFPAGQGIIQGETIDLAYALAQAWGMCVTRCTVVTSKGDHITLRGIYVDLVTVCVIERDYEVFLAPAPGAFAKDPVQTERWNVMQEQAAVSKAVRGAILGGLPVWYVEAGFQAAMEAADNAVLDGGKDAKGRPIILTLVEARGRALDAWGKAGLTRAELEAITGSPAELWSVVELAKLDEMYGNLKRVPVERLKIVAAERAAKVEGKPESATGVKRGAGKNKDKPVELTPRQKLETDIAAAESELDGPAVHAARQACSIPVGVPTVNLTDEQATAYRTALSRALDAQS